MIVVLMGFGAGIARLRSVVICFTVFCVLSLNEREGTFVSWYAKRDIISVIDWRR